MDEIERKKSKVIESNKADITESANSTVKIAFEEKGKAGKKSAEN